MPDDRSDKQKAPPSDQGRAGWDQVAGQDQLHWSDQRPRREEEQARSAGSDGTRDPDVPDDQDHGRNASLDRSPRDDDGFADYQARKDDGTPDTNWDQDDYRRTEFAGSLDGTNHPKSPPDIEGQPPLTLRPDLSASCLLHHPRDDISPAQPWAPMRFWSVEKANNLRGLRWTTQNS